MHFCYPKFDEIVLLGTWTVESVHEFWASLLYHQTYQNYQLSFTSKNFTNKCSNLIFFKEKTNKKIILSIAIFEAVVDNFGRSNDDMSSEKGVAELR